MRISDWSSDVCSSDLTFSVLPVLRTGGCQCRFPAPQRRGTFARSDHPIDKGRTETVVGETAALSAPDFSEGVELADFPLQGTRSGGVKDEAVLLSRIDCETFGHGGPCTTHGGHERSGTA